MPKYIPKGFSLYNLKCQVLENKTVIWADYYNNTGGHLIFDINLSKNEGTTYSERVFEENECKFLSEYSNENTMYYQIEDEYICLMVIDNGYYRITGNVSIDEMMKIREGIEDAR